MFSPAESFQWSRQVHNRNLQVLISDAPSESVNRCRSAQGKYSTSSPATAPEMLVLEVTPGFLAGAEPNAHQFMSRFVYKG